MLVAAFHRNVDAGLRAAVSLAGGGCGDQALSALVWTPQQRSQLA